MMEPIDANHTRYTDRVEIQAGWKTVFAWLWASAFYRHRQRKWIRLLKQLFAGKHFAGFLKRRPIQIKIDCMGLCCVMVDL